MEKGKPTQNDSMDMSMEVQEEQIPRRVFEINTVFGKKQKDRRFKDNTVCTSKYNCITFLPLNLFVQFSKFANLYFLILTIMQLLPVKNLQSYYGAFSTIFPVILIVIASMIKDIVEDAGRHRQDNKENNAIVTCCPRGENSWKDVKSKDLQVGSLVKLTKNSYFPADILILTSSLPQGICYVETKNLDGETNLKHKQAEKSILRLAKTEQDALTNFAGA